jgi:DNA-binding transcriptional LysR family regulator
MNLRSIDLNLLVILDALLDEAHVSRAAQRLGLTQPAVSAALQRCRGLFDDDLLQRGRGMMRPTARAEALRPALKSLLADVHALVDPPDIPLEEIRQSVRLIMADQVAAILLPRLLAQLARSAPGINVIMRPWHGLQGARQDLLSGDVDLALSVFDREIEGLERQLVLSERYVIAMRAGHPAAADFSLDRWLAYPHILVSGVGNRRGPLDDRLERLGRERRIGLVVPNFMLVPYVLAETDYIAMLPAHSLPDEFADKLIVHAPPIEIEGVTLHLAWPTRANGDKALSHVMTVLAALLAAHVAPAGVNCPALAEDQSDRHSIGKRSPSIPSSC